MRVVVTLLVCASSRENPLAYLLYCWVMVSSGFSTANLRNLVVIGAGVLVADAAATCYALGSPNAEGVAAALAVRSVVLLMGFLVAAFIAKSRSQTDLASDRGSYLQAILSLRNLSDEVQDCPRFGPIRS